MIQLNGNFNNVSECVLNVLLCVYLDTIQCANFTIQKYLNIAIDTLF